MDVRKQVTRSLGIAAIALGMAPLGAWAQSAPHPIRFTAQLDGLQSEAINSTALETRTGTGTADILFDPITGDLSYEVSFQGLIGEDITLGDPAVNPDGSTPPPMTVNGNSLPGGGLLLLHFHVGAPGVNGLIPIDIIGTGSQPDPGVLTIDPTPIARATAGRVTGKVNIFDRAMNGFLLNGVPVDVRDDDIRDPDCLGCGLIEAFLSNNVYVNIHTFNNPFGEIRGQALPAGCSTLVNTVEGLRSALADSGARQDTARDLDTRLRVIGREIARGGLTDRVRRRLGQFVLIVTQNARQARISEADVSTLVCGASNILTQVVTPPPAPAPVPPVDPAPPVEPAPPMMTPAPTDEAAPAPPAP